jgi:hypothetical protein
MKDEKVLAYCNLFGVLGTIPSEHGKDRITPHEAFIL